jgi:hypothetical protein
MSREKTVFKSRETTVDSLTGEILAENEVHIKVPIKSFEQFVILFGDNIKSVLQLDGAEKTVFLWVAVIQAKMNTNEFTLTLSDKEAIRESTKVYEGAELVKKGLSIGALNNAISSLVKKSIFLRSGYATYYVNPKFAWKGNLAERAKAKQHITLKIQYEFE